MADRYYLEIWRELEPKEAKTYPEQTKTLKEIKRFYCIIDAWRFVIENKIDYYLLSAGDCLIDQS